MRKRAYSPRVLAPIFSFVILVTIIVSHGVGAVVPEGADEYHERVRLAIESIPYSITDPVAGTTWVGRNVEVTPAAEKLLQPNKIMQRQYQDLETGRSFSLLLVHCKDVRDMVGHYPPNCYPASGWTQRSSIENAVALGEQQLAAREYRYTRLDDAYVESTLIVRNFFLLPYAGRARVVGDYDALVSASRGRQRTALGAAQVQILGGVGMDEQERQRITELFVRMIEPVIDVIGRGVEE
ncbi:MAG: exosortase-associated EpsI family protein [Phycisphaerales bacterium JB043]